MICRNSKEIASQILKATEKTIGLIVPEPIGGLPIVVYLEECAPFCSIGQYRFHEGIPRAVAICIDSQNSHWFPNYKLAMYSIEFHDVPADLVEQFGKEA